MRLFSVVFALLFLGTIVAAQAPARGAAPQAPARGAAAQGPARQPYGTLAQVMRGILFPDSNIIFDVQVQDPTTKKPDKYNVYAGWDAVENAAIAISEAANLITVPGRMCSNGKPVPLQNADFQMYVQGLADAGKAVYKAAQAKNQDMVSEATDALTDSCSACHEVYRDKGPFGSPLRCVKSN